MSLGRSLFLALFFASAATLSAQAPGPAATPARVLVNVDRHGIALEGHDPVAFFTDTAAVQGDSTWRASFGEAIYWFASETHRRMFLAEPAKYVPQIGGFCAYGASRGYPAKVEIETWQIIDGRLTLNYNRAVQQTFNQDVQGYLRKANENWPGIVAREGRAP